MVGTRTTVTTDQMSYIRKIRKPMVEKKRRERMNNSIAQLKTLIAKTIKQNTAPMTRVDKADILELTIFHLTQLQQQQQSAALSTEAASYKAGYLACAREAVSYLSKTRMTSAEVTGSLDNHLHGKMLQQSITQHSGNHFQYTQCARRETDRLSTPLRPRDSFNSPLPEMNFSGYSPIQDGDISLPELTSSFVYSCLNSSYSVNHSSSYSSATTSSSDISSCASFSSTDLVQSCSEATDDVIEQEDGKNYCKNIDVVTIGDGKENEVGQVIKDVLWRPF